MSKTYLKSDHFNGGGSKREGATFVVHVECKGPGGSQMLSDVTFMPREDKTIDFSDQDQNLQSRAS